MTCLKLINNDRLVNQQFENIYLNIIIYNHDAAILSLDITVIPDHYLNKVSSLYISLILCESESEVSQSCLTLCDPVDCSLTGFSVNGIFQERILEWVAISFPRGTSRPGIGPRSPTLQTDSLPSEPPGKHTCNFAVSYRMKFYMLLSKDTQ